MKQAAALDSQVSRLVLDLEWLKPARSCSGLLQTSCSEWRPLILKPSNDGSFLLSYHSSRRKCVTQHFDSHRKKRNQLTDHLAHIGSTSQRNLQGHQASASVLAGLSGARNIVSSVPAFLTSRTSTRSSRSSQLKAQNPGHVLCSASQPKGYGGRIQGSADLCLFPCSSVCLPTSKGALNLFEAKYLHLLDVIKDVARSGRTVPRFGLVLRDADEALSEESPGDASIGCCCTVEGDGTLPDGTTWLHYVAVRRFRIQTIHRSTPFQVATVQWLDDKLPDHDGGSSGARIDHLERELWEMCCQVARLTASLDARLVQLAATEASIHKLPAVLRQFAPLPPVRTPVAGAARKGMADIQVWRQSGRAQEDSWAAERATNPYWAARERMAKPARQEAFSFAAAGMVDLGPSEKLDLVRLQDTGARLAWVKEAIDPHLAALRAKHALLVATEKM